MKLKIKIMKKMIKLLVINHKFHYEMENLCRVFYPYETIRVLHEGDEGEDSFAVITSLEECENGYKIKVSFSLDETKEIKEIGGRMKGILSVELNAGQMVNDVRLAVECKVPVEHKI